MAKIKENPHPGALSELLKKKGMTQMDAFEKTRVDRKTLSKIDRGEAVKRETLQQVANKLGVPEEYFRHPPGAGVTTDSSDVLEPGTIMLRKLDVARLEELLRQAARPRWELNVHVREDAARKFLVELEGAVGDFWGQVNFNDIDAKGTPLSLREQLERRKTADDIAARLERLAEHRLALLGADHLFWECSCKECFTLDGQWTTEGFEPDGQWTTEEYKSSSIVLLSVEPFGTQSRRVHISIGQAPPLFAPDPNTVVFVNGEQLPSLEEL